MTYLRNKYLKYIGIFLGIFLFFFYRIVELNRPLWGDELISIKTLEINPLFNPFYYSVSTNLPLFYYLTKIYDILSLNLLNLRSLNILIAVTTIYYIYKNYDFITKYQKSLLILLIILSPIQIYYSIELRTYLLAQFLIIVNYNFLTKRNFSSYYWITLCLLLLTHYACYIYIFASFIYLLIKKEISKKIFIYYFFIGLLGIFFLFLISKNPGFTDSTDNSALSGNFERFTIQDLTENILKLREVITIYFNFGLHYYRIENSVLSVFKKFVQILLILYASIFIFKTKKFSEFEIQNLIIFILVMFLSIVTDLLGIMPFGGRHIFPFQFFYLLIISNLFYKISEFSKVLSVVAFSLIITVYLIYNTCLSFNLRTFVGNDDPQGVLISKCISN